MSRLIDVRACGCGRDDYSSTRQRHWIDHNFSEHVPADTIHAGVPHRYGSTGSAETMRMSKSTLRRSTASRASAATSTSDRLTRSLHYRATNPSTGLLLPELGSIPAAGSGSSAAGPASAWTPTSWIGVCSHRGPSTTRALSTPPLTARPQLPRSDPRIRADELVEDVVIDRWAPRRLVRHAHSPCTVCA